MSAPLTIRVPLELVLDLDVPAQAVRTWAALAVCEADGMPIPTYIQIGRLIGMSENTAIRMVRVLEANGWLSHHHQPGVRGLRNRYVLTRVRGEG